MSSNLLPPLAYVWSPTYLIIILVVVVLLFGGTKIPELMRGMGKGMGEFKKGLKEGRDSDDNETDDLRRRQRELEARKAQIAEDEAELQRLKAKSGD